MLNALQLRGTGWPRKPIYDNGEFPQTRAQLGSLDSRKHWKMHFHHSIAIPLKSRPSRDPIYGIGGGFHSHARPRSQGQPETSPTSILAHGHPRARSSAPAGSSFRSTYFHSATSSLRASATMPTRRMRLPFSAKRV